MRLDIHRSTSANLRKAWFKGCNNPLVIGICIRGYIVQIWK